MPNTDIQKNEPTNNHKIKNTKPNAPRTETLLVGTVANSTNGGMNKVITFKKVMAGEKHKEYRLKAKFQMLTPLTPTYQDLKATITTYFVPNSRIWKNAEKYTAQKKNNTETQIKEIPNIGGRNIPVWYGVVDGENAFKTSMMNTDTWRDSWISSYIPRLGNKFLKVSTVSILQTMPKISVLPMRGRIAIYNDFERNKDFDPIWTEYDTDTVTPFEMQSYLPSATNINNNRDIIFMRACKPNSYYTNFRLNLQGLEAEAPTENSGLENNAESLITWASWEAKIAEARSEAENAMLNDWEIIAKIRGSKLLTEGKVQKIGEKTFNLNYAAITQNTYNTNTNIREEFQVMGKQGAYSYTEVDIPLYAGMEFNEEGYIHVILHVYADTIYEGGIDRNELNITPLDEYRPDLINEKNDVLYEAEMGTEGFNSSEMFERTVGFKRKFSEYFKLPNTIGGDMTTSNYFKTRFNGAKAVEEIEGGGEDPQQIITQKTFQFFETGYMNHHVLVNGEEVSALKKPWKDYTDIHINKNQAIMNEIVGTSTEPYIRGNNQIFFIGKTYCIADLPIDSAIKNNYTTWGEH